MIDVRGWPACTARPRTCGRRLAYACRHLISPRRFAGHRRAYRRSSAPPFRRSPGLPRHRQHSRRSGFPPHHPGSVAPARRADRDRRAGLDGARDGATGSDQRSTTIPVRMEIATALDNGLPIIPVLVNGASMPAASELPDDLKDFSYRNALTIDRGRNFHRDADELVREIETLVPRGVWRRRTVAALVAAAAALVVGWIAVPDSTWHALLRIGRRRRQRRRSGVVPRRRTAGRSSTSSGRRSSAISSICSATPSCASARR